ncbi:MAG: NADP-dependent phosphogluconate dehydrogenase [Candidatus Neomarinimicrobiota bacterium]
MEQRDIGLIGLAVMGQNLVLNIVNHGFSMAVYNRTAERTQEFIQGKGSRKEIQGTYSLEDFTAALSCPRRIILMVKAGGPVDAFIEQLKPHLESGDIVMDAGNSHFQDTERRAAELEGQGIHYLGMGVSGGEKGALQGPSIMPGGPEEAYEHVKPILTEIAAKVDGEPCCTYIGPKGSGHYVKMVHNGIEYGIMQLIAETYEIMKTGLELSPGRLAEVFDSWNAGELNGYLMEITARILARVDPETDKPLVEVILDSAQQKGTGKWTSQNAFDLGVPIPTINAAVEARIISAYKAERTAAAKVFEGPGPTRGQDKDKWIARLRDALHASVITSYAQGLALIRAASKEYGYDIKLDEVAKIWRGGCIIRAAMLKPIRAAYRKNPALTNLMMDAAFRERLNSLHSNWRRVVAMAAERGLPGLALSASLGYYDMYRRERLPANLTQAQRDFFGAHTYQRVDREGVFHTVWEEE